jgi:hypothetical protein
MNMALEEVTPRTNPSETRRSMDATPTSLPPRRDARVGFFASFMDWPPPGSMREGEMLCPVGYTLAALYNGS